MSSVIRKITPAGLVTTLAGDPNAPPGLVDGQGAKARFSSSASGIAADAVGNLYVADDTAIRKVTAAGNVTTLAGTTAIADVDGPASTARFSDLTSIALGLAGSII